MNNNEMYKLYLDISDDLNDELVDEFYDYVKKNLNIHDLNSIGFEAMVTGSSQNNGETNLEMAVSVKGNEYLSQLENMSFSNFKYEGKFELEYDIPRYNCPPEFGLDYGTIHFTAELLDCKYVDTVEDDDDFYTLTYLCTIEVPSDDYDDNF